MKRGYLCEAISSKAFIQQLAVAYVPHGYWFYVTGCIPERKDPSEIDSKLIEKYGINLSRSMRTYRKKQGHANVHYLRHRQFFVLIATKGMHRLFAEEMDLKDIRKYPLKYAGYSVSFRGGHSSVRIEMAEYKCLKSYFLDLATRRSRDVLEEEFRTIGFEPYSPIRKQLLYVLGAVNRARKTAGYEEVRVGCLGMRRRTVKVFRERGGEEEGGDSPRKCFRD